MQKNAQNKRKVLLSRYSAKFAFFQVWQIVMFLLIVMSVVVIVLSTHPTFRVERHLQPDNSPKERSPERNVITNDTSIKDITSTSSTKDNDLAFNLSTLQVNFTNMENKADTPHATDNETDKLVGSNDTFSEVFFRDTDLHPALEYIDYFCLMMFTLELLLRFFSCPSKLRFFLNVYNVIDAACIIPDLVVTLLRFILPGFWYLKDSYLFFTYISVASVFRVFRLLKLVSHYRVLRLLFLAVKSSLRELLLLFILMIMGMLLFSTIIYFAEFQDSENCDGPCKISSSFESIPLGFWWSIVTMTTVGYGDIVPVTGTGYLIASLCAICGMLATGLPIPIIASNFIHYHKYDRIKTKLKERRKKECKQPTRPRPSVLTRTDINCCCCFIRPSPVVNSVLPARPVSSMNPVETVWEN